MDGAVQHTPNTRKRSRENETESQKIKREKAAERQRRKRERDRANAQAQAEAQAQVQAVANAASISMMPFTNPEQQQQVQHLQHHLQHVPQHPQQPPLSAPTNMNEYHQQQQEQEQKPLQPPQMTKEEIERRDKVRAAARERQRKHRLAVKQRKMRELGMDMSAEIVPPIEDLGYRPPPDFPVLHGLQQHPPPHMPALLGQEPPFPGGQLGGQTFASTLLLSFSCAPLLKAHLLRTLNMTNEELASLEPVIADAWDRWNSQRQLHYAEAAKNGAPPNMTGGPSAFPVEMQPPHHEAHASHPAQPTPPTFSHPNGPSTDLNALDFRNRFSHHLNRPLPTYRYGEAHATATTTTPTSTTGSGPNDQIDPHLATNGTAAPPKSS